jgi:hypothetical protein
MCKDCGHAQLLDIVDPNILYGNYIYTSSSSTDLDKHFSEYADSVVKRLNLKHGDRVLDIGSNDGLLLSKFKAMNLEVIGVDPSEYVANKAAEKGIQTVVGYFNEGLSNRLRSDHGKFNLVTANNVFSHADNLMEFAECVEAMLLDSGAFVFEVSYLKDLVEGKVIDYIYHEHLCHHSIKPLKEFLNRCGLKLIYIERVKTKGGSIRCYAVKLNNSTLADPVVDYMINDEVTTGLYNLETYLNLSKDIALIRGDMLKIVDENLRNGGSIATYGASATSTVLGSIMGISPLTSFIIDDNLLRQNRLSPGYMIPVLDSKSIERYQPTSIVILAWRFAENIIKNNPEYLASGGMFIVPLPELKVYKA